MAVVRMRVRTDLYEGLPVAGVEDGGGEDEGEDCAQH